MGKDSNKKLTRDILQREREVPFSEVLTSVSETRPKAELSIIVTQTNIGSSPPRLALGNDLVYPFYSFKLGPDYSVQLNRLAPEEQQHFVNASLEYPVRLRTEFVRVSCQPEDKSVARELLKLMHSYFVTYELPRVAERTAPKVLRSRIDGAGDFYGQLDGLKELNKSVFDLHTTVVGLSASGIVVKQTNLSGDARLTSSMLAEIAAQFQINKQAKAFRLFSDEANIVNCFAVPMRVGIKGEVFDVMVLTSASSGISPLSTMVTEQSIRLARSKFEGARRATFERDVQQKIVRALSGELDPDKAFADFCSWVVSHVGELTGSHSVTLRKFSSFENALTLIAQWKNTEETPATIENLPCDKRTSVNAFCYSRNSEKDFVYLPDIASIPEEYKQEGLTSVTLVRPKTKSEFCIAIGARPLRLGTLNFESPYVANYDLDVQFIESAAFHIFQYWKAVNSAGDVWWLSQLSLTHLATHELRDFKNSLPAEFKKILDQIIYTVSPSEHFDEEEYVPWSQFVQAIRAQHRRMSPAIQFEEIWQIEGIDETEVINSKFLGSLRLIANCLLSNAKHSIYSENKFRVELVRDKSGGLLKVTYISNVSFLDPETILEIEHKFRKPSLSADGWHFGLFLIGVHARLLGGDIQIDPNCKTEFDYAPFSYMVRIPMPEVSHAKNNVD